jgi:hypothetical protein
LWGWLEEEAYVSDADRPRGRKYLLKAARRQLRLQDEMRTFLDETGSSPTAWTHRRRERAVRHEAALSPDDPIVARAEALSLYWAKLAATNREVEWFREEALGGHTVSGARASRLVRSSAASILPLAKFKRECIPIVGHEAELLWIRESAPAERPFEVQGELKISWAEGEKRVPFSWKGSRPLSTLPFWDGEKEHLVRALRGSVLEDLYDVATKLARTYPWEPSFGAWLVLTDERPWVPPLTARISGPDTRLNHRSITITAAHWVPTTAVSSFYADVKARTNPAPTPSLRRLAVFRFIVQHSEGIQDPRTVGLKIPGWRPLLRMWNEEHPPGAPWHYHDVRNFRRDYLKTFDSLVNPFRV